MSLEGGHRIDVHHHISPPTYLAALRASTLGAPPTMGWTLARSIDDMDRAGVARAFTSLTTPAVGPWVGDAGARRRLARECNEYAARLVADHPGRFGMFAALPMPDVDASLGEIAYALDTLHADGIALLTSYRESWLGDAAFAPLLDELNRRRAVVYTHPTTPPGCLGLLPAIPESVIEYATDTSRTIASVVFSGTAARCPQVQMIFSHAGGTMPFLIERFTRLPTLRPELAPRVPDGVLHELRRFHYDIAQSAHPMALGSLLQIVSVSQVLFGTDFPFRTSEEHVTALAACGFTAAQVLAIERDNALRLLPRAGR
jgi:6-methylsalicylate decarboxylase